MKTISITHKIHEDEYNYFCDTYKMKNLVATKVQAYLAYMQLISGEMTSLSELENISSALTPDDRKTQIERLDELSDIGFIESKGKENKKEYAGKTNFFITDSFSDNDPDFILRFLDFVSLMRNKIQPYVCGNMLLETALMFFEDNKKTSELVKNYTTPFFVNDGHFEQVLDDEVLYRLITAMSSGKQVSFNYDSTDYKNVYPIKAVTNVESGLRYLFAYKSTENQYAFLSLDKITKLKVLSRSFDYEKYEKEYETRTKYSFSGVTFLNDNEEPAEVLLKVKSNDFLKEMKKIFKANDIETDKPEGQNYYTVKVRVNTLEELKPWLRRNMNNVKLAEEGVISEEIEEMRMLYGIV